MEDLVLSVVKGLQWRDIDCYAISLSRSGYTGKKVMLVEDVPEDAQNNLRALGFEVIPFSTPTVYQNLHFQTSRYFVARDYLKQHAGEFAYAVWTDVVDLVFQADPIEWLDLDMGAAQILAAKEGWLIKNQGINDCWIKRLVSGDEYDSLREQEVLCSGSILGEADAMLGLFGAMCSMFSPATDMQGIDQGVFNVLMRRSPFKDISRAPEPEEGLVSTCGIFLADSDLNVWTIKPPVFDRATGLVCTESGQPFCIAHQYNRNGGVLNRDGAWRTILESRYRN